MEGVETIVKGTNIPVMSALPDVSVSKYSDSQKFKYCINKNEPQCTNSCSQCSLFEMRSYNIFY